MSEPRSIIDRREPTEPQWPDTAILELSAQERHSPVWDDAPGWATIAQGII